MTWYHHLYFPCSSAIVKNHPWAWDPTSKKFRAFGAHGQSNLVLLHNFFTCPVRSFSTLCPAHTDGRKQKTENVCVSHLFRVARTRLDDSAHGCPKTRAKQVNSVAMGNSSRRTRTTENRKHETKTFRCCFPCPCALPEKQKTRNKNVTRNMFSVFKHVK